MLKRFRRFIGILSLILMISVLFNTELSIADTYYVDTYDHWAEDTIYWATNRTKLFNGYEDGTFRPDNNINRSEFIAIIYRSALAQGIIKPLDNTSRANEIAYGSYESKFDFDKTDNEQLINDQFNSSNDQVVNNSQETEILAYTDLNEDHWAYDAVKAVSTYVDKSGKQITFKDIFPGEDLQPNRNITREEAAVLSQFFTTPPIEEKNNGFEDISIDYKYYSQISQLANNGIITGYSDNTFRPKNNITRAEAATIIQRLYLDMEFLKGKFLHNIELVENDFLEKFPHFGDYENVETEKEDMKYRKSIATLEYKSIVKYIPYEEQHLYDMDPIQTLNDLRETDYHNLIGVNYYLIKYGNYDANKKSELYNEILKEYMKRDDLDDYESIVIFKEEHSDVDMDNLTSALEKWYDATDNQNVKINIIFLLARGYLNNGNYDELIDLVNMETDFEEIEIIRKIAFNKALVMLKLNDYTKAEVILREGWEKIKDNELYNTYKTKYDNEFIGAIKEVLIQKIKLENSDIQ